MNTITATIKPGDTGAAVANLQDALFALLDKQIIRALVPPNHPTQDELVKLTEALKQEHAASDFGAATRQLVHYFQIQQGLGDRHYGVVEDKTAGKLNKILKDLGMLDGDNMPASNRFIVKGQVTDAMGKPSRGVTVRAYDRDLRSEQSLGEGETSTDSAGNYTISYTASQFNRPEKGTADLVVRAYDADGKVLVVSPISFNVGIEAAIDLVLPSVAVALTEFERLTRDVMPELGGLAAAELTEEDLSFLAGDTGWALQTLEQWRDAAVCARTVATAPTMSSSVPNSSSDVLAQAIFFGWFRQKLPADLAALWQRTTAQLINALQAAVRNNIIPKVADAELKQIADAIDQQRAMQTLRLNPAGSGANLGDVLNTMPKPLSAPKQLALANALLAHPELDPDFDAALTKQGFSSDEINQTKLTVRLGRLTGNNLELIRPLQGLSAGETDGSLAYLAKLAPVDWCQLVYDNASNEESVESLDAMAASLGRYVEIAHPTAVIAARLQQGMLNADGFPAQEVQTFLAKNPDFDFFANNVNDYLEAKGQGGNAALNDGLLRLQRTVRLSSGWNEAQALLNRSLDSSLKILRLGPEKFAAAVSDDIPATPSGEIFATTQKNFATGIAIASIYGPYFNPGYIAALQAPAAANDDTLGRYPNLRSLFGDIDNCVCDHCASVVSPAAYFVDLMQFAYDAGATTTLWMRRPDLFQLLLTCENTDTELPYLDLVLELLENAVALPGTPIPIAATAISDMDAGHIPDAVRNELAKTVIELGPTVAIDGSAQNVRDVPGNPRTWRIKDGSRRWVVWLYEEALLVQWPNAADQVKVPSTTVQQAVDGLNERKVTRDLYDYFAAGADLIPVVNMTVQVSKKDMKDHWTLVVERLLAVTVDSSKVVWQDNDGKPIANAPTINLTQQQINSLVSALSQGKLPIINNYLPKYLPESPSSQRTKLTYKVTKNAAKNRWEITTQYNLQLSYQSERLQVQSLIYNSSSAQQDLLAQPENFDPQAYRILADSSAVFPWVLPFNLFLEQVRSYLEKTGVPRLRVLQQSHYGLRFSDAVIAREVLHLSKAQSDLIFAPTAANDRPRDWGLDATTNAVTDPDDPSVSVTGDWITVLQRASILLHRSGLREPAGAGMRDLLNLLECQFIAGVTPVVNPSPKSACLPSKIQLVGLGSDHLDRMHRFLRLWRVLGWTMHDLDRVIAVITTASSGDLAGNDPLVALSLVERLRANLDVPVAVIACWLGKLETLDWVDHLPDNEPQIDSIYKKVFLNSRLNKVPDTDFDVDASGDELAYLKAATGVTPKNLADKADRLSAALGVKKTAVARLLDEAFSGAQFNLTNLSSLYRQVTFAKSLDLSVDDYLLLRELIGDPFGNAANPIALAQRLLDFAEQVRFIAQSGFSLDELNFILRDTIRADSSLNSLPVQQLAILTQIRTQLDSIRAATLGAPTDANLRAQLSRLGWYPQLIDFVMGPDGLAHMDDPNSSPPKPATISTEMQSFSLPTFQASLGQFNGTVSIPASYANRIIIDSKANIMSVTGWLTDDDLKQLNALSTDNDYLGAVANLKKDSDKYQEAVTANQFLSANDIEALLAVTPMEDRYAQVLKKLAIWNEREQAMATLGESLGLPLPVLRRVIDTTLSTAGGADPLADLIDDAFVLSSEDIPVSLAWAAGQIGCVGLMQKIAMLLGRMQVKLSELRWLAGSSGFVSLDFASLRTSSPATTALYDGWREFVLLCGLRKVLPEGSKTAAQLYDDLLAGDQDQFNKDFATAFEVSPDDVERYAGKDLLNLSWPDDFRDPARIHWLCQLQHTAILLGANPDLLLALITENPDVTSAQAALQVLHAASDDRIHDALKSATDRLREAQRNALAAYLIQRDQLADSIDLYSRYLIDPEMSSCMITSRLKQAISSVQLFIQRCLLNVEPEMSPDAFQNASRWLWMKNYRVWEANRKVFLYPENWLEPELRDDKSELFSKLESELLQDEVTSDRAVQLLQNYIDGLRDIARLTVCGMFRDEQAIHIVARTLIPPYEYYYRKWMQSDENGQPSYWTPWETITAKPNSDHVIPFVWKGAVYIGWLSTSNMQDDTLSAASNAGGSSTDANQLPHWTIQFGWARRTAKGWLAPKLCRNKFTHPALPNKDARQMFALRVQFEDSLDPQLWCYGAFEAPSNIVAVSKLDESPITSAPYPQNMSMLTQSLNLTVQVLTTYTDSTGSSQSYYLPLDEATVEVVWEELFPAPGRTSLKTYGPYTVLVTNGIAAISQPTNAVPPWFYKVTVTAAYMAGKYPSNPDNISAVIEPNFAYTGTKVFTFDVKEEDLPPGLKAEVSPSRPVTLNQIARLPLKLAEMSDSDVFKGDELFAPLPEVEHYASGYREIKNSALNLDGSNDSGISVMDVKYLLCETQPKVLTIDGLSFPVSYQDSYFNAYVTSYGASQLNTLSLLLGEDLIVAGSDFTNLETMADVDVVLDTTEQKTTNELQQIWARFDQNSPLITPANNPTNQLNKTDAQFALALPYAGYDWELFFHAPLLVATALTRNHRFQEAQDWFHLIFNPTRPQAQGYWRFEGFDQAGNGQSIETLLTESAQSNDLTVKAEVDYWLDNPFQPHAVARMRVRAYQWATVLKYLDNLLAWGDSLFRLDTIESINEATQLYLLAAEILGRRPVSNPSLSHSAPVTYQDYEGRWDEFANQWESAVIVPQPVRTWSNVGNQAPLGNGSGVNGANLDWSNAYSIGTLVFCVPANEQLLTYWDALEDRLFKIRHCMNIEGVIRQLPLFEPPIDPGLLVRAAAAGLDIGTVLADLNTPLPFYRFSIMLQKALELNAEVRALGAALLLALEKKDAEHLALLRSTHELQMLDLVKDVKQQQQAEAARNLEALRKSRELTSQRYRQYQRLLGKSQIVIPDEQAVAPLEPTRLSPIPAGSASSIAHDDDAAGMALIAQEANHLGSLHQANDFMWASAIVSAIASIGHFFPNFSWGSQFNSTSYGGSNIGSGLDSVVRLLNAFSSQAAYEANKSSIDATFARRYDDWVFQSNLAVKELEQIDKQILAAEIRKVIADKEYANHLKQIENTQAVDAAMRDKFSNEDLYQWMIGQISGVYFQAYQFAYDLAKRAEQCYRCELGLSDSNFIRYGYWDSLKKGLVAGEKLYLDLKRMDVSYLEQNKREYELTKHISLLQLDPNALLALKMNGNCDINLPEWLFDLDFPGHYMRRIKSMSLTIPCVVGPYTNVNCKLTLVNSWIRISSSASGKYQQQDPKDEDKRFRVTYPASEAIATSHAQNDAGLFEVNFRDERYLPFEGNGAVSQWKLDLPPENNQFDVMSVSDVILHVKYTAREGGQPLADSAKAALTDVLSGTDKAVLTRVFSLRQEFSTELAQYRADWKKFLADWNAAADGHKPDAPELKLDISGRFPILTRSHSISVGADRKYFAQFGGTLQEAVTPTDSSKPWPIVTLTAATGSKITIDDASQATLQFDPLQVEDLFVICNYQINKVAS